MVENEKTSDPAKIVVYNFYSVRQDQIPVILAIDELFAENVCGIDTDSNGYIKHFSIAHSENLRVLPDRFDELPKLEWFEIHNCSLEKIPPSLGKCTLLKRIIITNCNLKEVPPELGQLPNLYKLNLSNNHLKSLPDELETLGSKAKYHLGTNFKI